MPDLAIEVLFRGNNLIGLLGGLWATVRISLVSVGLSIPIGLLVGMVMTLKNPMTRALSRIYLDFVRIIPQLVLLSLMYLGGTRAWAFSLSPAHRWCAAPIWRKKHSGTSGRGMVCNDPLCVRLHGCAVLVWPRAGRYGAGVG